MFAGPLSLLLAPAGAMGEAVEARVLDSEATGRCRFEIGLQTTPRNRQPGILQRPSPRNRAWSGAGN